MSIITPVEPRNAWEAASLVMGGGFLTKTGKMQALKPLSSAGEFNFFRSSGKYVRDKNGDYVLIGANIPPVDYDPVLGKYTLLIEPGTVNLFASPRNFEAADWQKSVTGTGIVPVITPNFGTLKGFNASKVTFNPVGSNSTDSSFITQTVSIVQTGLYTIHLLIKSLSGTQQLRISFAGVFYDVVVGETPSILKVTHNLNVATNWTIGIRQIGTHTRTNGEFLIAYAQIEAGVNDTSFANGTRAADLLNISGTTAIGAQEGFMYVDFDTRLDPGIIRTILGLSDGSTTNRISIRKTSTDSIQCLVLNGVTTVFNASSANNVAGRVKAALGYKDGNWSFYINGTQIGSQLSGNVPPGINQLDVGKIEGANGTNFLKDRLIDFSIGKKLPSNAFLQRITTL